MPKYIFCQGCPASGKSTWANKQIAKSKTSIVRINRDDIRREMFNFHLWKDYKFTSAKENSVTEEVNSRIAKAAAKGLSIIDDNTNLNNKYLVKSVDAARKLGYEVEFKTFFDVPLHELIDRNLNRELSVPEDVIHRMFRAQLEIQGRIIKPNPALLDCVLVDVDGTIAHMGKGEKWGRGPFEWDKVLNDKPKTNVIKLVQDLWTADNRIIFLTGRDGVAIEDTKKWINLHVFNPLGITDAFSAREADIYIRTAGDMRPDCVIKEELLRANILPKYNVKFALDDRNQMVDHYRALGIECWQVDAGRF